MIFSRRIVFYTDSGPRTSPLSGSPVHDFLVAYSFFIRILSGVPAIKWNMSLESRIKERAFGHTYIYIHMNIYTSVYIYIQMRAHISICLHAYTCIYFFTLELTLCVSMIR